MEHSVPKRRHIKFRRRGITKRIQHLGHGESLKSRICTDSLVTPVSEQILIVFKMKSTLGLISYLLRNSAMQCSI